MKQYKKIFESVESDIEEIENIFIDFVDDEKFKITKVNDTNYTGQKIDVIPGQQMRYEIQIGEINPDLRKSYIKSFDEFAETKDMIEKLGICFKRLEYKGFSMEVRKIAPDSANILVKSTKFESIKNSNLNDFVKYFYEFGFTELYITQTKQTFDNVKQEFKNFLESIGCKHLHIPSKLPPHKFKNSERAVEREIKYERIKTRDFIYKYHFDSSGARDEWRWRGEDYKHFFELYLEGDQRNNTKLLDEIKKVDPSKYKRGHIGCAKWDKQYLQGEIYNLKLVEHKGQLMTKVLIFLHQSYSPIGPINFDLWRQTN